LLFLLKKTLSCDISELTAANSHIAENDTLLLGILALEKLCEESSAYFSEEIEVDQVRTRLVSDFGINVLSSM